MTPYIFLKRLILFTVVASYEISVTNKESLSNFTNLPSEAILTNLATLLIPAGNKVKLKIDIGKYTKLSESVSKVFENSELEIIGTPK